MDAKGSVSMVFRDALRILLRNVRPSLPPELIIQICSFLPKREEPEMVIRNSSEWSQSPGLCHWNEELWQIEWLTSLAKVNRELDELLRPLLWTNVAIYVDADVANLALIIRLRQHLERNSGDRRSIRRLTLDLTVESDYIARIGQPFDKMNEWVQDRLFDGWPFEGIEGYEEECIRLAATFPEALHTLQVNCGQLRLHSRAWRHIADRCPSLVVVRIDANAECCPFRKDFFGPPSTPDPDDALRYPQEDDAFYLLRSIRGLALGCGPEPWPMFEDQRWRMDDLETVAIGAVKLTEWLQGSPEMLWIRLAAPEMSWQPSLFGVWARLLGLASAPLERQPDDAFVVGSSEHIDPGSDLPERIPEFDVLYDAAAMAIRPHLDALVSRGDAVTPDAVLQMIASEPELVAWTWNRANVEHLPPFFSKTSYEASSAKERNRVDNIVSGYLSTAEARRRGRELGCPFEGPEYMEENTVEFARAHLLREMPSSWFGRQVLKQIADMSPSFAESARKAKRIE